MQYLIFLGTFYVAFGIGYVISLLFQNAASPLVGLAVAMIWGVLISGSNPNFGDVLTYSYGIQWIWTISYSRWANEAFYINEVGPYSYVGLDWLFNIYGWNKHRYWELLFNPFMIGIGYRIIAVTLVRYWQYGKKK